MRNLATPVAIVFMGIAVVGLAPRSANASLMWEFGFSDRVNDFEGTGSFTLGGPTDADGLAAFEFSGVCGQNASNIDNPCSFGLADLGNTEWILNDDWTFETLNIEASINSGMFVLDLELNDLLLDCFESGGDSCNGSSFDFRESAFGDGAFLTPIHDVPEPSTVALFALGLLALGRSVPSSPRRSTGAI